MIPYVSASLVKLRRNLLVKKIVVEWYKKKQEDFLGTKM
jgi:hypothetical protein